MPIDYNVFLSYAHADNTDGWVTRLRDAIVADHKLYSTEPLEVFFDTRELSSMDDWQLHILAALQSSDVLVVCLSPAYFASEYCHLEFEEYLRRSSHVAASGEGIATVYFVEVPDLGHPADPDLARWQQEVLRRQANLEPWFPNGRNRLAESEASRRLREIATGLGDAVAERLRRIEAARKVPGNIRAQSPAFVGRTGEARELHDDVLLSAAGTVAVLHGLGGMGKTELAVAYAHQFRQEYRAGVWWLPAEGQSSLWSLISRLAAIPAFTTRPTGAGDPVAGDAQQLGRYALEMLRERVESVPGPDRVAALVVLDNVDHPGLLSAAALSELGSPDWLRILVTTRLGREDFGSDPRLAFMPVGPLTTSDGVALIAHHQPEHHIVGAEQIEAAARIVELLDGFTLAVEQVAIHLGLTGQKPTELLAAIQSGQRTDDLMDPSSAHGYSMAHREKLLSAVLVSTMAGLPALEVQLLRWAAHLPPERIPWSWLRGLAQRAGLLVGQGDAMSRARRRLEGRRLLLPGENFNIARMHRLVAADLCSGAAGSLSGDSVALYLADRAADPAQVAAECADAEALATMLFDLTDPNSPLARVTRNSAHLRSPGMDLPAVATTLALAGLRDGLAEVRDALAPVIAGADGMSWLPVATSDRADPRLDRTLTGHTDWVNDVALGHTGAGALVVATASHDTTVGLWRPRDGTRLATLTGHTRWASTVAFAAPPDPVLASGGWDGTIRFWNPSDGSPLGCLAAHDGPVFDVAWGKLPDGRRILASGGADELARIWDGDTHDSMTPPLVGHMSGVRAIACATFRGRGVVATGSLDTTIRLWDASTARALGQPLRGHDMGVLALDLLEVGDRLLLASASLDGTVRVWDAARCEPMGAAMNADAGAVRAVAFLGHPAGPRVASAHWEGSIRLWDALTGTQIAPPLVGHEFAVTALRAHPDGSPVLASAGADDTARIWHLDRQTSAASPGGSQVSGWPVSLTLLPPAPEPGGARLLVLRRDGTSEVLAGDSVGVGPAGATRAVHVAWPGSPAVVTISTDGSLRFLDPQTWETRATAAGPYPPRWLAATEAPDGRPLVAVASDRVLTTWDQSADCLALMKFPADITALAGGGRCVAVALADGWVLTLDSADLAVVGRFRAEQSTTALCVLTDPWEDQIVLGGSDGQLDIVTAHGQLVTTLVEAGAAPLLALTSLPLPSGESLLIGAASDLTVRAWLPARSGVPPRVLGGFPDTVTAITALAQPGGKVLVGLLSGTAWTLAELSLGDDILAEMMSSWPAWR